jgi:hypothetical protein
MRDEEHRAPLAAPVGVSAPDLGATGLARVGDERPESLRLRRAFLPARLATHTCPQCGLNPAGPLRRRWFQYVPPWVNIGIALNVFVLFILYLAGRKRVELSLGLCGECVAAERRARLLRGGSVLAAVFAPFAPLLAADEPLLALAGAGVVLVGGVVGSIVTHVRTRSDVVGCERIDQESVVLRASPSWRRVLADEAPEVLGE